MAGIKWYNLARVQSNRGLYKCPHDEPDSLPFEKLDQVQTPGESRLRVGLETTATARG